MCAMQLINKIKVCLLKRAINCRYSVEEFPRYGTVLKRVRDVYYSLKQKSWVISWSSKFQLDRMALMICKLQKDVPYSIKGMSAIDFDEADDAVRTPGRITRLEQQLRGIFALGEVIIPKSWFLHKQDRLAMINVIPLQMAGPYAEESHRNWKELFGDDVNSTGRWQIFPPIDVTATTSSPLGFLWLLTKQLKIPLKGWANPPLWDDYHGIEDWDVVSTY